MQADSGVTEVAWTDDDGRVRGIERVGEGTLSGSVRTGGEVGCELL